MKKIKELICRIFGHNRIALKSGGGYCDRCGWAMYSEEYQKITKRERIIKTI